MPSSPSTPLRVRREPPPFRTVAVARVEDLSPRMVRVVVSGPALEGFETPDPAASVRLLLPSPGTEELVMPTWNGNEFLLPDGRRPTLRTFTPRHFDPAAHELVVDVVVHGGGAASEWARRARPGAPAAVSGPGRGYRFDGDAPVFILAGDETAIPAMSQLLEVLPSSAEVRVTVEIAAPDARQPLPSHPGADVEWRELSDGAAPGQALLEAAQAATIDDTTRVWVAGEAAGVQRIRRHLFEERGISRRQATVRGYWKHGRTADAGGHDDDDDT